MKRLGYAVREQPPPVVVVLFAVLRSSVPPAQRHHFPLTPGDLAARGPTQGSSGLSPMVGLIRPVDGDFPWAFPWVSGDAVAQWLCPLGDPKGPWFESSSRTMVAGPEVGAWNGPGTRVSCCGSLHTPGPRTLQAASTLRLQFCCLHLLVTRTLHGSAALPPWAFLGDGAGSRQVHDCRTLSPRPCKGLYGASWRRSGAVAMLTRLSQGSVDRNPVQVMVAGPLGAPGWGDQGLLLPRMRSTVAPR